MKRLASASLILVVLVVAGCGGGGTTTKVIERTVTEKLPAGPSGGTETTADQEPVSKEAGEKPSRILHLRSFRSPSGNIGCQLYGGGARCDIRKRDWKPPPRPSSCSQEVDYGQGLQVSRRGEASFVCAGDTALDPSSASLAYGTASRLGGTECVSREGGITCVNQAGHGFFISVQSYQIF